MSSPASDPLAIADQVRDGLQLSLFDDLVDIAFAPGEGMEERFERFHQANPHVFRAIVKVARDAKARGMRRWSINGVFEVLRWIRPVDTKGDPWRLNNDFRALYARKLMDHCPDLEGFFETRRRRGEEGDA